MKRISAVIGMLVIGFTLLFASINFPSGLSEIKVSVGNGYGTTGVYVRTFSTVDVNTGTAITYASDAVNGDYFTINAAGVFSITYSDGYLGADYFGLSVNSSTTTPVVNLTTSQRLCFVTVANSDSDCSTTYYLNTGDKIRAHWTAGGTNGSNPQAYSTLTIIKR